MLSFCSARGFLARLFLLLRLVLPDVRLLLLNGAEWKSGAAPISSDLSFQYLEAIPEDNLRDKKREEQQQPTKKKNNSPRKH